VALIGQVAEYIIQSGGKRVRPALLLMVSGAISTH
jgi:geranylgeranyl pyrophosphate synthase